MIQILIIDISELGELGWEISEEYVTMVKPFEVLTASVSRATGPTVSIPERNKLKHAIQTDESLEATCLATCLPTLKEGLVVSMHW
jgi:hypothetical protein